MEFGVLVLRVLGLEVLEVAACQLVMAICDGLSTQVMDFELKARGPKDLTCSLVYKRLKNFPKTSSFWFRYMECPSRALDRDAQAHCRDAVIGTL